MVVTEIESGLKVTIDGRTFVAKPGDLLGREGTLGVDCFIRHATISRRHVEISKKAGRWFVTVPESVANSTMLDNMEVVRGKPCLLTGKHILRLSKACVVVLEA